MKAEKEYERYQAFLDSQPRSIDTEFEKVVKQLRKPVPRRPGKKRRE